MKIAQDVLHCKSPEEVVEVVSSKTMAELIKLNHTLLQNCSFGGIGVPS